MKLYSACRGYKTTSGGVILMYLSHVVIVIQWITNLENRSTRKSTAMAGWLQSQRAQHIPF